MLEIRICWEGLRSVAALNRTTHSTLANQTVGVQRREGDRCVPDFASVTRLDDRGTKDPGAFEIYRIGVECVTVTTEHAER